MTTFKPRGVSYDKTHYIIDTGLAYTQKSKEILNSIFGQMSDGIWENSPAVMKYWFFADVATVDGNLKFRISTKSGHFKSGLQYSATGSYIKNPYLEMSDDQIRKYFANKLRQIAKIDMDQNGASKGWKADNTDDLVGYLSYGAKVTVADAYSAYKTLCGK